MPPLSFSKNKKSCKSYLVFFSFVFRSSTGKTTLIKRALSKLEPETKAVLLQVRPDELSGYAKVHSNIKLLQGDTLKEGLESVEPGSYVIIEDIIHLSKKDEQSLRSVLNYGAHHNKLRVLCVAHLLYRTSLLTLVPLFNYLIFTMSNSSRGLIKTAATYGFNLDSEKASKWVEAFSRLCLKHGEQVEGKCIFISCNSVKMFFKLESTDDQSRATELANDDADDDVDDNDDDDEIKKGGEGEKDKERDEKIEREKKIKRQRRDLQKTGREREKVGGAYSCSGGGNMEQRFADCFSGEKEKSPLARAFVSIVAKVLREESTFREQDLSLGFRQARKPGKLKRISVVDYVSALLDSRPGLPPTRDQFVLHRYLCERCKIPKLFVKNHYFYEISLDASADEDDEDFEDVVVAAAVKK